MKIFREKAGVISQKPLWVMLDGPWLYLSESIHGLIWEVITGWRKDRNLVG